MDDTQQSRADAAATRKRRSSILKNQRAPRAPFSELEFNVTTPTDTGKSRRVSFSRRTGVAEFITNEATTTWKNFYEEHNKTLESSGNESEVNAPRPSCVGHLGKRIFEDQFQEVEIIDSDLTKIEYNNIDSIADDSKLPVPQQNFELSALTATGSKLFEDNLAISRLGEITDNINVNFSVMQPLGDDLDEIQKDLERHASNAGNVVCQGPSDRNMSEYIEVDLNATHAGLVADDAASDDMSITDTIHSPKVNVSKNSIVQPKDKSQNIDWVADKENMVMNPYIAPTETNNFAINEESDKILVFDGKRLTIQSQSEPFSDYRKTLLPNSQPDKTPLRKTIVLNVDDDLPNFVADPHASMSQHSKHFSLNNSAPEECDISATEPIEARIQTNTNVQQICMFESSCMHSSSSAFSNGNAEKRRTIVFDSDAADISVTQAVPSSGILNSGSATLQFADNRKTIVFEDDAANVSMTQALPVNFFVSQNGETFPVKRRTIVYETDGGNISVTQIVSPPASAPQKRKTIVFNESEGDISLTQAIPANLILPDTDIFVTQIVPLPLSAPEKRKTIVFNESQGNISLTQAIPSNHILPETDISVTQMVSPSAPAPEKRKTIVFNESQGNISLTQAIPSNLILPETDISVTQMVSPSAPAPEKRKTIVFNESEGNISLTQAIPSNLIIPETDLSVTQMVSPSAPAPEKRKTIVFNESAGNISVTQALPANIIILEADPSNKEVSLRKDVSPDKPALNSPETSNNEIGDVNISTTQVLPTNISSKTTAVNDKDSFNMSVTQAIPSNLILENEANTRKTVLIEDDRVSASNETKSQMEPSLTDISVTQAVPANLILPDIEQEIDRTKVFENAGDISTVVPVPSNTLSAKQTGAIVMKSESETSASSSNTTIEVSIKDLHQTTVPKPDSEHVIEKIENKIVMDISKNVFDLAPNFTPSPHSSASHPIPLNLISLQKNMDELKKLRIKELTAKAEHSSGFMVYQAAATNELIPKNQLDVPQEETLSLGSDTTGSLTPSAEYDGQNKLAVIVESITSTSSDAFKYSNLPSQSSESKDFETASYRQVELSDPSISSNVDKSCSNIKSSELSVIQEPNSESATNIRAGILDSLLDMNDSFISNVDRSVSPRGDVRSPSVTASAETMFMITRDDEGMQTKSVDELVLKTGSSGPGQRETVCEAPDNVDVDVLPRRSIADSTADLLDLISQFAEKGDQAAITHDYNDKRSKSMLRRQSVALSREDLMNNISSSQEMVQNANSPESGSSERSSPPDGESDVVKMLRFEDEDDVSGSTDQVLMISPLKKTVFGESSYMVEEMKKHRVIPSYLKDVSDGMKALMTELMKPMSDEMPFEVGSRKKPCTRNRHVQTHRRSVSPTNIELDDESLVETLGKKLKGIIKKTEDCDRYHIISPVLSGDGAVIPSEKSLSGTWEGSPNNGEEFENPPTLLFDPDNPLNNVLIKPIDLGAAHRYNPEQSPPNRSRESCSPYEYYRSEGCAMRGNSLLVVRFDTGEDVTHNQVEEKVSKSYNVHVIPNYQTQGDDGDLKKSLPPETVVSKEASESKLVTVDAGVDACPMKELRNQKVNTAIAMQDNKSLLLESSSLTLVESLPADDIGTRTDSKVCKQRVHSPLQMIYKQTRDNIIDDFSDTEDRIDEQVFAMKRKHNGGSDNNRDFCTLSALDHIPSPDAKLPRMSYLPPLDVDTDEKVTPLVRVKESLSTKNKKKHSPTCSVKKLSENHRGSPALSGSNKKSQSPKHRSDTDTKERQTSSSKGFKEKRSSAAAKKDKRSPKKHSTQEKPNTNVMVQFTMLSSELSEPREDFSRSGSQSMFDEAGYLVRRHSDTSGSKGDDQSLSRDLARERGYPLDWQPELINELSSKNLVTERENDVNVCDTIINLPFMGTYDCQWEWCSTEEWRFLLLHGRLRLLAALCPSEGAGADPRVVRADTPVTELRLEATLVDMKKGSAGILCVRFATETMRFFIGRECSRAGDVPTLLRRCAGVSRVALRWGRAMHHAWSHLAYSITEDGFLSLKVANIALRSVWEVTMKIEMTMANARDVPWPRATNVRVMSVVSNTRVEQVELQRALTFVKEDWGHVPRTLWRIFKFLKKKTEVAEEALAP